MVVIEKPDKQTRYCQNGTQGTHKKINRDM
jgi:hypothetical protein